MKDRNQIVDSVSTDVIKENKKLRTQLEENNRRIKALEYELATVKRERDQIVNSKIWKWTQPLRLIMGVPRCIQEHGWKYTIHYIFTRKSTVKPTTTNQKMPVFEYLPQELEKERKTQFQTNIKFSVIVPLYNTQRIFLKEMIESVQQQTYANWELCMADGSDSDHAYVEKICLTYCKQDPRMRYRKLDKNEGISGNTNASIQMATGDYIVLFDHDDIMHLSALYECMKVIESQKADYIYTDEMTFVNDTHNVINVHYKPDYSPDTLRSYNYICHLSVFSKQLLDQVGLFNSAYDGSQDYDMILRLTEKAKKIVHIPKVLYFWRAHEKSVAQDIGAKPYTIVAAKKALEDHLKRVGLEGTVEDSRIPSAYRIAYNIQGNPKVSIIIPNMDHVDELKVCIDSVMKRSSYQNIEIIVVENNSVEKETLEYYDQIQKEYRNVKVVYWKGEFNFSAINNYGFQYVTGEYVLLLNNDIEVISEHWIEEMLMYAQRPDVGAVGALLYYPDDTVQHAGVILGIGGVAGHSHKNYKRGEYGYASRLALVQNLSAVTAACMMMPTSVYQEVDGLDESFKVAFNDVDLCMRIREKNYLIVFTPYAELYHYESKSRGLEDTEEKQLRFKGEVNRFMERWGDQLEKGDPYYNPNLSLTHEDFSFK